MALNYSVVWGLWMFKLVFYLYLSETPSWKHDDTTWHVLVLHSLFSSSCLLLPFLSSTLSSFHLFSSPLLPPHISVHPPSPPLPLFWYLFFPRSVSVLAGNIHWHVQIYTYSNIQHISLSALASRRLFNQAVCLGLLWCVIAAQTANKQHNTSIPITSGFPHASSIQEHTESYFSRVTHRFKTQHCIKPQTQCWTGPEIALGWTWNRLKPSKRKFWCCKGSERGRGVREGEGGTKVRGEASRSGCYIQL